MTKEKLLAMPADDYMNAEQHAFFEKLLQDMKVEHHERIEQNRIAIESLDTPADPSAAVGTELAQDKTPRTLVASMTPIAAAKTDAVGAAEIVIRTRAESWLEISGADGQSVEKGLVPAGTERRYGLAQVQRLTIGNASAVDVEYRGQTVDIRPFATANVARFAVSSDGSLVAAD